MATQEQLNNAVGFYAEWSTDVVVEKLEGFEYYAKQERAKKKPLRTARDEHMVELLYHVLDQRGFFMDNTS